MLIAGVFTGSAATSARGKLELTMSEDDGHEDKLIHRIIDEAVKNIFTVHLDVRELRPIVDYFESGQSVEVFLVADEEQVSTPEFVERLAHAADTKPRLFPLPIRVLSGLLTLAGQPDACESLIGSLKLDLSKAASTGWRDERSILDPEAERSHHE